MVDEGVQQLGTMGTLGIDAEAVNPALEVRVVLIVFIDRPLPFFCLPVLRDLVQDVNFIVGSFYIVLGALLYLKSNITVIP